MWITYEHIKKSRRMKNLLSICSVIVFIIFCSCENETDRDKEGLIIYQENQISWIRNFEPLNPVSVCRWPTKGAIYEPLYIYNPIKTDWTPWLATDYTWQENNKKLLFTIRTDVQWSDGQPFSAHDVAYTFNLTKEFPALDTRNYWDLSLIHI